MKQLVFEHRRLSSCDIRNCEKDAVIYIPTDVIKFDLDLCKEHARELAEQLMKVTSAEVTNEQRNKR